MVTQSRHNPTLNNLHGHLCFGFIVRLVGSGEYPRTIFWHWVEWVVMSGTTDGHGQRESIDER